MRCDGRQIRYVPSALTFNSISSRNASFVTPAMLALSRPSSRVLLDIRRKLPSFAECPELHARGRRRRKDQAREETACQQFIQSKEYHTDCVGVPGIRDPELSRLSALWRMQHAQGSKVGLPRNVLFLNTETRTLSINLSRQKRMPYHAQTPSVFRCRSSAPACFSVCLAGLYATLKLLAGVGLFKAQRLASISRVTPIRAPAPRTSSSRYVSRQHRQTVRCCKQSPCADCEADLVTQQLMWTGAVSAPKPLVVL